LVSFDDNGERVAGAQEHGVAVHVAGRLDLGDEHLAAPGRDRRGGRHDVGDGRGCGEGEERDERKVEVVGAWVGSG